MPYYVIKKKKLRVSNNRFVIHDDDCPKISNSDELTNIGFHTEHNAALLHISLKRNLDKFFSVTFVAKLEYKQKKIFCTCYTKIRQKNLSR